MAARARACLSLSYSLTFIKLVQLLQLEKHTSLKTLARVTAYGIPAAATLNSNLQSRIRIYFKNVSVDIITELCYRYCDVCDTGTASWGTKQILEYH